MKKGIWLAVLAVVLTAAIIALPVIDLRLHETQEPEVSSVDKSKKNIVNKNKNENSTPKEDVTVINDETVTFLVELEEESLVDVVLGSGGEYQSVNELILSSDGKRYCDAIKKSQAVAKAGIKKLVSDSDFSGGRVFSAIINGLTVKAPLSAKSKIEKFNGVKAVYVLCGDDTTFDNSQEPVSFDHVSGTGDGSVDEVGGHDEQNSALHDESYTETVNEEASLEAEVTASESYGDVSGEVSGEISGEVSGEISGEVSGEISGEASGEVSGEASDTELSDEDDSDHIVTGEAVEVYEKLLGAEEAYAEGYTGRGMLISVIDSEFDTGHEVFSEQPYEAPVSMETLSTLYGKISFNTASGIGSDKIYVSSKIPFAYDYSENDTDTADAELNHGTAAAAAAAGNNGLQSDESFRGVAFDAQLALMKVSGGRDGYGNIIIQTDAFLAALDDSMKLGTDVIDLSFGSYDVSDNEELLDVIFSKLDRTDVIIVCAAGNGGSNGSVTDSGKVIYTNDIYYGTENYISDFDGVVTAASCDSGTRIYSCISVNGNDMENDSADELKYKDLSDVLLSDVFTETGNYVYLGSTGAKEDYEGEDVTDCLVVLDQGELAAADIISTASYYSASAVAVIADGYEIELPQDYQWGMPFIILPEEYSTFFENAPEGEFLPYRYGMIETDNSFTGISGFDSYAVNKELKLSPRILTAGENVYSARAKGGYDIYSGTSQSSVTAAGAFAVLKQYLLENTSGLSDIRIKERVKSMMFSSSKLFKADTTVRGGDVYESPRLQGYGKADIGAAIGCGALIDAEGSRDFIYSIGDGTSGEYGISFSVTNITEEEQSFVPSCVIQTDSFTKGDNGKLINTLIPQPLNSAFEISFMVDGEAVDTITVPAGETVDVTAAMTSKGELLTKHLEKFPNGFYLDGYVFLARTDSDVELHIPFAGFCGEFGGTSPFDSTIYDEEPCSTGFESSLAAVAVNGSGYDYTAMLEYDGDIFFSADAVRNVTDDSAYGSAFIMPDFYTLCNVYDLTVTLTDSSGNELVRTVLGSSGNYRSSDIRPFEKLMRNALPLEKAFENAEDGRYTYTVSARCCKADGSLSDEVSRDFSIVIDSSGPTEVRSETYADNGKIYLALSAKDNYSISGFELYAATYSESDKSYDYNDTLDSLIEAGYISDTAYTLKDTTVKDGTVTWIYDITELKDELTKLTIRTSSWSEQCSTLKIVFKAYDEAKNVSDAKVADTIVYGTAEFVFKDAEGHPAKGITVTVGSKSLTTDKTGSVMFESLAPDYYKADISFDEEEYELENTTAIVEINNSKLDFSSEQTVVFKTEYVEEESEDEASETESAVEADSSEDSIVQDDADEPLYAVVLIGTLLLICVVSFILRKIHVNKI